MYAVVETHWVQYWAWEEIVFRLFAYISVVYQVLLQDQLFITTKYLLSDLISAGFAADIV